MYSTFQQGKQAKDSPLDVQVIKDSDRMYCRNVCGFSVVRKAITNTSIKHLKGDKWFEGDLDNNVKKLLYNPSIHEWLK